jgi:hypothetical protein
MSIDYRVIDAVSIEKDSGSELTAEALRPQRKIGLDRNLWAWKRTFGFRSSGSKWFSIFTDASASLRLCG